MSKRKAPADDDDDRGSRLTDIPPEEQEILDEAQEDGYSEPDEEVVAWWHAMLASDDAESQNAIDTAKEDDGDHATTRAAKRMRAGDTLPAAAAAAAAVTPTRVVAAAAAAAAADYAMDADGSVALVTTPRGTIVNPLTAEGATTTERHVYVKRGWHHVVEEPLEPLDHQWTREAFVDLLTNERIMPVKALGLLIYAYAPPAPVLTLVLALTINENEVTTVRYHSGDPVSRVVNEVITALPRRRKNYVRLYGQTGGQAALMPFTKMGERECGRTYFIEFASTLGAPSLSPQPPLPPKAPAGTDSLQLTDVETAALVAGQGYAYFEEDAVPVIDYTTVHFSHGSAVSTIPCRAVNTHKCDWCNQHGCKGSAPASSGLRRCATPNCIRMTCNCLCYCGDHILCRVCEDPTAGTLLTVSWCR